MSERPDIGRMIQEELDKQTPEEKAALEARGEKPLEVTAEGALVESDKDIDDAVDAIMDGGKESRDAMKMADLGADAARKIQLAFEKGDMKSLNAIAAEFVGNATAAGATEADATSVLREQLKAYHDTYFEAGLTEKAAEIDAFSRSLESTSEVSTDAGKAFLATLEAGGYSSVEDAINALDDIKNQAAKGEAGETKQQRQDREGKLNAEFNALYAKINDKFLGSRDSGTHKIDIGDDDIDDVLGALG